MIFWILLIVSLIVGLALFTNIRSKQKEQAKFQSILDQTSQTNFKDLPTPSWLDTSKKIAVVYNPISGGGFAKTIALKVVSRALEQILKGKGEVVLFETQSSKHAQETARSELKPERYCAVFVCGGDGTYHDVINGLGSRFAFDSEKLKSETSKMPLVFVPAGSGNGLSTSLGSKDALEAVTKALNCDRPKAMDLMEVCIPYADEEHKSLRRWEPCHVSTLSIVFFSLWQEQKLRNSGLSVGLRGLVAALITIFSTPNGNVELSYFDKDDKLQTLEKHECTLVTVANIPRTGTDNIFAPTASFHDGLVDIVAVKRLQIGRLLNLFGGLEKGTHINDPAVTYVKAKRLVYKSFPPHDGDYQRFVSLAGTMFDGKSKSSRKDVWTYELICHNNVMNVLF